MKVTVVKSKRPTDLVLSDVRIANDRLYCNAVVINDDGSREDAGHQQFDLTEWPDMKARANALMSMAENGFAFRVGLATTHGQRYTPPEPVVEPPAEPA